MTEINLLWEPPGPIAAAFMGSNAGVQILNGPIGSGKTTTIVIKNARIAARQAPSTLDGIRKVKICAVAITYRQLWRALLPSWWSRFPRDEGFTGTENGPAVHRLAFRLRDGTLVDMHVDFLAIGENAVEDVLRGYEPTWFWLYEFDLLPWEVYLFAKGRAGRYPPMSEGGPTWYGILGDCNAPEFGVPAAREIFAKPPDELGDLGIELFVQPSGFSPQAENKKNLPPGYYEKQAKGQPDYYVQRMIENRPGYSRAGKPVYPEFIDAIHVAKHVLEPVEDVPLQIGLDAGMSPAAVFGQHIATGQWLLIDELVGEPGTGPTRFGRMLAQRLRERFPAWRNVRAYADPSAAYGVDKQMGEASWIEIVAAEAGIRIDPAPTNSLIPRLEAVRRPMTTLIDGKPGLVVSPRCTVWRQGANSGYRFRRMQGQDERYAEEPEKNEFSHVHDAGQYLLSGGGEDQEIRGRKRASASGRRREAVKDWEPLG